MAPRRIFFGHSRSVRSKEFEIRPQFGHMPQRLSIGRAEVQQRAAAGSSRNEAGARIQPWSTTNVRPIHQKNPTPRTSIRAHASFQENVCKGFLLMAAPKAK